MSTEQYATQLGEALLTGGLLDSLTVSHFKEFVVRLAWRKNERTFHLSACILGGELRGQAGRIYYSPRPETPAEQIARVDKLLCLMSEIWSKCGLCYKPHTKHTTCS